MAEVYRARDELLGREVALKVLSSRFSSDRAFVERFRREAQAAANLSHPNIVSLFDYGADDGTYFIVMEYIDGRSLGDVIKDSGALMPERAAEIAIDVAKALQRAHDSGLVHRDIKPSNIMITRAGETKVTDFGIARAVGGNGEATMTQTGMVMGTASYLSPEQAQGNPVDARSDLYSLGVVLYEMLVGEPPFAGESPLAIAYKHVRETPVPPSRINPNVPAALDAVVMKALAKNPDNRYQSARELAEDLERFLSGAEVQATPLLAGETMVAPATGTGTQVLREAEFEDERADRRRAGLYLLSALGLLVLFGVLAVLLFNNLLGSATVEVPRVVGLQEGEAVDRLEAAGLAADIRRRPNEAPEGEVFRQEPKAGEEVQEGSEVRIYVSQGPQEVAVPDLIGLPLQQARLALRDEGLKVGSVTREPSDEYEQGEVIRQSYPPGATVPTGTAIDLVVSSGPETVIVPYVVGQTEEQARANLEASGLVADVVYTSSDEPEGTVIDQEPDGGTEAQRGDTVQLLVSQGPEARPMPDVRGMEADEAERMLEADYGLNVSQVDNEGPCAHPPGFVCAQEPEPGTEVQPGDEAILYVQPGGASTGDGVLPALALPLLLLPVIVRRRRIR
jgi:serine/threonine-protein kinase